MHRIVNGRQVAPGRLKSDAGLASACEHAAMAGIVVEQAGPSDAPALAALNAVVHDLHVAAEPYDFRPTVPHEVQAFFEFILGAGSHVVFLATAGEVPVGYLWVEDQARGSNTFKNATRVLHLNHISVNPSFRRQGVGRSLYSAAEAEARVRGIDRLAMDHWTFNSEAAAFFGSLGFESFNVRMRKQLPDG
jgi:ribosomal protein S18 acetylase RimI-like enzyme